MTCHSEHYATYGTCRSCHRGIEKSSRKNIAHHMLIFGKHSYFRFKKNKNRVDGEKIIDDSGCRRCHTIGNKGGLLASNLDISINNIDIEELIENVVEPATYMPDFQFRDIQLTSIINGLLSEGFGFESNTEYVVVHLDENQSGNLFSDKCGGCHKTLSKNYGGLGSEDVGPNLSGLFTKFFPNMSDVKIWNEDNVKKWLKNPREIKKITLMPVLGLKERDIDSIIDILK